jgi:hypothetical protein
MSIIDNIKKVVKKTNEIIKDQKEKQKEREVKQMLNLDDKIKREKEKAVMIKKRKKLEELKKRNTPVQNKQFNF